jgi:hypothetical protein
MLLKSAKRVFYVPAASLPVPAAAHNEEGEVYQ